MCTPGWRALTAVMSGGGWVSPLCVEPRLAAAAIEALVAPLVATGRLLVVYDVEPTTAETSGDRIGSVTLTSRSGGRRLTIVMSI